MTWARSNPMQLMSNLVPVYVQACVRCTPGALTCVCARLPPTATHEDVISDICYSTVDIGQGEGGAGCARSGGCFVRVLTWVVWGRKPAIADPWIEGSGCRCWHRWTKAGASSRRRIVPVFAINVGRPCPRWCAPQSAAGGATRLVELYESIARATKWGGLY